jgi:hypothetical protein
VFSLEGNDGRCADAITFQSEPDPGVVMMNSLPTGIAPTVLVKTIIPPGHPKHLKTAQVNRFG